VCVVGGECSSTGSQHAARQVQPQCPHAPTDTPSRAYTASPHLCQAGGIKAVGVGFEVVDGLLLQVVRRGGWGGGAGWGRVGSASTLRAVAT